MGIRFGMCGGCTRGGMARGCIEPRSTGSETLRRVAYLYETIFTTLCVWSHGIVPVVSSRTKTERLAAVIGNHSIAWLVVSWPGAHQSKL